MVARREHLLVDGYNLIKSNPLFQISGETLKKARTTLEEALGVYGRRTDRQITLYYDGTDQTPQVIRRRHKEIEIHFSQYPEKADDLIMLAVQQKHGAKWLRVISSDREIRRFAKRHKIRSTSAEDFLDELEKSPSARTPQAISADDAVRPNPDDLDDLDELEALFTKRPPDTAKPRRQQHGDGTEPNPSLNPSELDEWEHLFGRDEDL